MFKSFAKSAFRKLGLEVRKTTSSSFPTDSFNAQKQLLKGINITNPTIFDIGANKGDTTRQYKKMFPDSTIYSFEPFPESLKLLKKKFKNDTKVKIIPLAVADKSGERTFYLNKIDATHSLLPRPRTKRRYYPKKSGPESQILVNVTTIDEFINCNKIDALHILKLDIQGGERMALHGAVRTLREKNMLLIYTEIMFIPHYEGNPLLYELWDFLNGFGYSLFNVYNLISATNGQLRYGDAIFVSDELRNAVIDKYQEEP